MRALEPRGAADQSAAVVVSVGKRVTQARRVCAMNQDSTFKRHGPHCNTPSSNRSLFWLLSRANRAPRAYPADERHPCGGR